MVYLPADSQSPIPAVTGPGLYSNFVDRDQRVKHDTTTPLQVSSNNPTPLAMCENISLVE